MNFDIVIANPPYDRTDIQMKFGLACFDICKKYNVMIIPAKWQCKGDKTKEKLYSTFRKEVVPHMSKICFYPEPSDVFNVFEASGISYYIAEKNKVCDIKTIENRCGLNKYYNDIVTRPFRGGQDSLNNKGQSIINKLGDFKPYLVSKYTETANYQYWINGLVAAGGTNTNGKALYVTLRASGNTQVISPGELNTLSDVKNGATLHPSYYPLFNSDSMLKVVSFISYAYTKFIRFLIFNSICGLSVVTSDTWWRFVPDPVAFDHLFTDEELYKKYNLTPDEIAIIEGTIAERPFSTVWSWIPKEYQELAIIK